MSQFKIVKFFPSVFVYLNDRLRKKDTFSSLQKEFCLYTSIQGLFWYICYFAYDIYNSWYYRYRCQLTLILILYLTNCNPLWVYFSCLFLKTTEFKCTVYETTLIMNYDPLTSTHITHVCSFSVIFIICIVKEFHIISCIS